MAEYSINDLVQLINQQIDSQESVSEKLTKAKIMLDVALEGELLIHPPHVAYHYLWAVSDFIGQAADMLEASLNYLLKTQKLNFPSGV